MDFFNNQIIQLSRHKCKIAENTFSEKLNTNCGKPSLTSKVACYARSHTSTLLKSKTKQLTKSVRHLFRKDNIGIKDVRIMLFA